MAKFGVRFVPIREEASFKGRQIPQRYKEALYAHFTYPLQLDSGTVFANESVIRTEGEFVALKVASYKNLEDILSNAKTSDLLLWITKDDFLKNCLMAKYETSIDYPLTVKRKIQINGRQVPRNQVRNYIAHTFTFAKWIQIGEKRYSPNQIILDEKIGMQLEPRLIGKRIDFIFADFSAEDYEINAIIGNLGFISDFSKIEPSALYAILNELSNDNGRLYCFDGKFHKVQEVRYADKSFPDRVRANHCLIHLPKNRGAKKAETWFGIKEFQPDVTVRSFEESSYNRQFQEDFHDLLKGLYIENCHQITDEKRWRSVKNMRIVLASSINLSFDETEQSCEVYQYAKDDTGQYVLMIGHEKPDPFDERLTSALFEIVRTVINIDDPALGSSFRDLWKFPGGMLRKALVQRNEDENIWQVGR